MHLSPRTRGLPDTPRGKGTSPMLTPSSQSPHERGKRWLQTKVQDLLATSAAARATPGSEDNAACYWARPWRPVRPSICAWQAIRNHERCTLIAPCCAIAARDGMPGRNRQPCLFAGRSRKWGSCPPSTLVVHGWRSAPKPMPRWRGVSRPPVVGATGPREATKGKAHYAML